MSYETRRDVFKDGPRASVTFAKDPAHPPQPERTAQGVTNAFVSELTDAELWDPDSPGLCGCWGDEGQTLGGKVRENTGGACRA